ncbi:MAG: DUF4407 domain-containing protein [Marinilabiliaceae bacterium]|nr:DUF4407 domain-containing protein [Marinilabiliaceae bacterium]
MTTKTSNIQNLNNKTPNIFQRFFIMCSGSDKSILDQCPTEWNKYTGIGATIFFTGLLASISGGYALFSIFRGDSIAILYALIFGFVWGLLIFNLDRFIVSSIRKENNIRKELIQASPRFLLAIIISLVIAKPLEVRLFENRIEQQILENKRKKLEDEKNSIDKLNDLSKLEGQLTEQNKEIDKLNIIRKNDPSDAAFIQLLNNIRDTHKDLSITTKRNNERINEYNKRIKNIKTDLNNYIITKDSIGSIISKTLKPNHKAIISSLNQQKSVLENEIRAIKTRLTDIETDIKNAREYHHNFLTRQIEMKQSEINKTETIKANADSIAQTQFTESIITKEKSYTNNFITQLEAMGNLTENNKTMQYTSWMIILLFIVVETAPIVVKLMSKRGPYDVILERIEQEHLLIEKDYFNTIKSKTISINETLNQTNQMQNNTTLEIEKTRLNHELENNKKIMNLIAKKHEELSTIKVEKWFQQELKNINPNIKYNLINTFWIQKNHEQSNEYYLSNGADKNNQLLIINDDKIKKGNWMLDNETNNLEIILDNNHMRFNIIELTKKILILENIDTKEQLLFENNTETKSYNT